MPSSTAHPDSTERATHAWLWPGIVVPPLACLASLSLAYALVPPACDTLRHWIIDAATAFFLVLTLLATWRAWLDRSLLGRMAHDEMGADIAVRRFVAALGVLLGALFALVIAAQWATRLAIAPCFA